MMTISVRTSSGKPISTLGYRLKSAIEKGGKLGTTNVARMMTRQLKIEAPKFEGHLEGSIKSRTINENTVGIFMNRYGPWLETGHAIRAISANSRSAFWRWIVKNAIDDPYDFRAALLRKGKINKNTWITKGIMRARDKIAAETVKGIRAEVRKEGLK